VCRLLKVLFVVFMVALSVPGCEKSEPEVVTKLRWLDKADAIADANAAFAKKHYALKAVNGYTTDVPGADSPNVAQVLQQFGHEVIEGTSDMYESDEHGKLVEKAYAYAKGYNMQMAAQWKSAQANNASVSTTR
jgi:uncharacterized protein (DUF924 family)